jgi:addiction module HigA family antidote
MADLNQLVKSARRPVYPGKILRREFLEPSGMTQDELATALHVTRQRINRILNGKQSITADTAIRLSRFYGVSPQFFMNLQVRYDLACLLHRSLHRRFYAKIKRRKRA